MAQLSLLAILLPEEVMARLVALSSVESSLMGAFATIKLRL